MLFHKKNKKLINTVWTVICVLVIAGMILLYLPNLLTH